jgi:hypothetical protein
LGSAIHHADYAILAGVFAQLLQICDTKAVPPRAVSSAACCGECSYERDLSLGAVAARQGISLVYVLKLFEGESSSFSEIRARETAPARDAIWRTLDKVRAKHPNMVLLRQPEGGRAHCRLRGRQSQNLANRLQAGLESPRQDPRRSSGKAPCRLVRTLGGREAAVRRLQGGVATSPRDIRRAHRDYRAIVTR